MINIEKKRQKYDSIRIFKNPILESFTHVHPIIPLILWTPVVAYFFYRGVTKFELSLGVVAIVFLMGIVIWTLTEYVLHRYVFHFPAKSAVMKRFVFLFHGLHHDDPNDPTRLVFPPVPAVMIVFLLYQFFALLIPAQFMDVFMGSFLIGYLCYDYIHYATHHFPMDFKSGKVFKKISPSTPPSSRTSEVWG